MVCRQLGLPKLWQHESVHILCSYILVFDSWVENEKHTIMRTILWHIFLISSHQICVHIAHSAITRKEVTQHWPYPIEKLWFSNNPSLALSPVLDRLNLFNQLYDIVPLPTPSPPIFDLTCFIQVGQRKNRDRYLYRSCVQMKSHHREK